MANKSQRVDDISDTGCFEYPYTSCDISIDYDDPYNHPVSRLVISFAAFGKKFPTNEISDKGFDKNFFRSVVRMTGANMIPQDFNVFATRIPISERSRIVCPGERIDNALKNLRAIEQIIVAHYVSHTQWMIHLVSLQKKEINIYVIGDIDQENIQVSSSSLQASLGNQHL